MEDLLKINNALEYIESNLTGQINISDVAKIAYCSTYNFQRMFSFLTDIPLSEYIRNRRLSLAALDLQKSYMHVGDVADKYGYNSPTAFTRAFTAFHGLTPHEARQPGATLVSYPRISFSVTIKGGQGLEFRIENKEGFDVFGIEVIASTKSSEIFEEPSRLWSASLNNGNLAKILQISKKTIPHLPADSDRVYGVINYRYIDDEHFAYMICSYDDGSIDTSEYTTAHIPAQTYVIIKSEEIQIGNPESAPPCVQKVQSRFYSEWLPVSGYEKTDGPEIEVYFELPGNLHKGYVELWFPVKRIK